MFLDDAHHYTLLEISKHFANLFGERISATIFEEVKRVLIGSAQ